MARYDVHGVFLAQFLLLQFIRRIELENGCHFVGLPSHVYYYKQKQNI